MIRDVDVVRNIALAVRKSERPLNSIPDFSKEPFAYHIQTPMAGNARIYVIGGECVKGIAQS